MSVVDYDRISENPANFEAVFSRQLSLADDIRKGDVEVEQGNVESKALYGATKALEGDLRSRMFADQVSQREKLAELRDKAKGVEQKSEQ